MLNVSWNGLKRASRKEYQRATTATAVAAAAAVAVTTKIDQARDNDDKTISFKLYLEDNQQ